MPGPVNVRPHFFGVETELALAGTGADGNPVPIPDLLGQVERTARRHLVHVGDLSRNRGMFLTNGGRLYRDAAGELDHLELCSPEVDHPSELVSQLLAGERLMLKIAELAEKPGDLKGISLSAINHCYENRKSWGHHENYQGHAPASGMMPFLATRFIVCGGGGLVNQSNAIRFTLSPRIHFISVGSTIDTQNKRGLYNEKAEPLGSTPRTHVIISDGLRSHFAQWIRLAITSLVVRVLESGGAEVPPSALLREPVRAAHRFALDPSCTATARTVDGQLRSATQVQRDYLSLVEQNLAWLPEWAPLACERWASVLDHLALEDGCDREAGRLDWCAKKHLVFDRHLERDGWSWEKIEAWNGAIERLEQRLRQEFAYQFKLSPTLAEHPDETLRHALDSGWLWGEEIDPGDFVRFASLRAELQELDLRYMLIGPGSLFERLDVLECLDHRLAEVAVPVGDPLDPPPPSGGRAKLRAELVREHGSRGEGGERFHATWTRFMDTKENRQVEMPDASRATLRWRILGGRRPSSSRLREVRDFIRVQEALHTASRAMDQGELAAGIEALRAYGVKASAERLPHLAGSYWRAMARLQGRSQALEETCAALKKLARYDHEEFEVLCDQSNMRSILGLRGHSSTRPAVSAMERHLQLHPDPRFSGISCWRAYAAGWLNRNGEPSAARALLEGSLGDARFDSLNTQVACRIRVALSESLRLSGSRGHQEAVRLVDRAVEDYRRDGLVGPLSEVGLIQQARVRASQGKRHDALHCLGKALPLQTQLTHPAALRTILLTARLDKSLKPADRKALRSKAEGIIAERSAYRECPLARRVVGEYWDAWVSGADDPAPPGGEDCLWGV